MFSLARQGLYILYVVQILYSLSLAVPKIDIRKDFLEPTDSHGVNLAVQSYSGIIKFEDGSVPLDKARMTDAKLLHLCRLAYNEMIVNWRGRRLSSDGLPAAMAAIAHKDSIYFVSSLKAPQRFIKLKHFAQGTVREIMDAVRPIV